MHPGHASLLARWSGVRSEPIAGWAWGRLVTAGAVRDPAARTEVIAIATDVRMARHPRRAAARATVATWWFSSRAAVAAIPSLLTDADPAVRKAAEEACTKAAEPLLGRLWREVDDTSLEPLTRNRNKPSSATLEIAIERSAHRPGEWLLAAATAARTQDDLRKALVTACRLRKLAPADQAERAAFYLLTEQSDRYRAADPDGALLRVAYEAASQHERSRLRAAMIKSADLDLIRMLTSDDKRWRGPGTSDAERDTILRILAARKSWPELWRVTSSLPLTEAVTAIRRLFGTWRPPHGPDRTLFDQLASADPASFDRQSPRVKRQYERRVRGCAVSPDGSRLAVAYGDGGFVDEYALPSGERMAVEPWEWHWPPVSDQSEVFVLHTGEAIIVGSADGLRAGADGDWWDLFPPGRLAALAPTRDGFVASVRTPADTELAFGTTRGRMAHRAALAADLGLDKIRPRALATQLDAGVIAVGGRELVVLSADATQVVARSPMPAMLHQVAFTGPQSIVTVDDNDALSSWHCTGTTLAPVATVHVADVEQLIAVPMYNRVALLVRGKPQFHDATTLAPADSPVDTVSDVPGLWCSSGGHLVIDRSWGEMEVRDPISALAERPLCETTPADLATVENAVARPGTRRHQVLELLRACLRHEFGSEIALGSAVPVTTAHDIALGGTKELR